MCSSKESESDSDSTLARIVVPAAPRVGRRRLWVLAGILCAVLIAVTPRFFIRHNPELPLAEARTLLAEIPHEPSAEERLNRAKLAAELLQRYLSAGGNRQDASNLLLCAALSVRGIQSEAITRFELVNLTGPDTEDILLSVRLLFGSKQFQLADQVVDEAVRRRDNREAVLRLATLVRYELGRNDDVLAYCDELTRLAPLDPGPWLTITFVYEKQGKLAQTIEPLRKFISLAPKAPDFYQWQLIEYLLRIRHISEARLELDRLRLRQPAIRPQDELTEARLFFLEGEHEKSAAITKKLLLATPDDPAVLMLQGEIQLTRLHLEEAIASLNKVVQILPADQEAHYLLGQAYSRHGDLKRAQHHLDRHHWLIRAKTDVFRLERLAGQRPYDIDLRQQIVTLCQEIGWPEKAEESAQRIHELRGPSPEIPAPSVKQYSGF